MLSEVRDEDSPNFEVLRSSYSSTLTTHNNPLDSSPGYTVPGPFPRAYESWQVGTTALAHHCYTTLVLWAGTASFWKVQDWWFSKSVCDHGLQPLFSWIVQHFNESLCESFLLFCSQLHYCSDRATTSWTVIHGPDLFKATKVVVRCSKRNNESFRYFIGCISHVKKG